MADTPFNFDPVFQGINAATGIAGGLINGFAERRDNRWFQNALIEIVQRARQGDEWARTMLQQTLDPASQAALSGINLAGNQLWQGDALAQTGQDISNSIPGMFQQNMFGSPAMAAARARMEPLADNSAARGDVAAERFYNGGRTAEYDSVFNALQNYLTGGGSNSQLEQQNVAANLLSQRGQTAFTQGYQDRGMDALNAGGLNDYLKFALSEASKQIQSGGLTPEGSQAINMALQLISDGGENATTQRAQEVGLNKASQDTVLPLQTLRGMAGDAATTQLKNSLRDLYSQAAKRGGGPGITIANGLNDPQLTDYLDRAADVRGKAESGAASAWMDAAQKDAALGSSLLGTGGGLANSRFGQAAGLFSDVNNNAASRMNTAFGAIPGTQNSATNVMQTLGQLGLGGMGMENSRMQTGAGLANDFNQGLIGFNNVFGNTANNMNNFSLGLGGLSNQFTNSGANINNMLFGNDLNAGQLNLGYAQGQSGAQNNAFNNQTGLFGQFSNNYNNAINQRINMAGQYNDYARAQIPLTGAYQAYGNSGQPSFNFGGK